MKAPTLCPKCQQPLGEDSPHEVCPACLVEAMMLENGGAGWEKTADATIWLDPRDSAGQSGHLATMIIVNDEASGDRIGRYKLLQQIGEGGFGTVWMAEQAEPEPVRVALKIIKLGMDTREVIARFEAERQALAMMNHPNIAKVFDAGATDKGRPFFVMELVKGIPITQFCDEMQLGARDRLALFGDVCSAINHAHQKGIIHRDIKPSNVMVTLLKDRAVVKVIDFGIAKAIEGKLTDKTLFTRFDQFMGTPVYMSPEQASLSGLDIDTRSDVYALGILLYELLTGSPPFDAQSLASMGCDEMRRIIREVEPAKPSARLGTLPGNERTTIARARQIAPEKLHRLVEPDLDWIVMKAIEKDRTRRYATANGLVLDIERFLADEPVSATPPGAGYRFRKFARRHKPALSLAAAGSLVLVAATGLSLWQGELARHAAEDAVRASHEAFARAAAEKAAREESETISRFLSGIFERPDSYLGGPSTSAADCLGKAVQKLETEFARQPATRARLQGVLADTYGALGLPGDAVPLHEKARDYYLAAHGQEAHETLVAQYRLAGSYYAAGREEEALKLYEEILPVLQRKKGK